MALKLRSADLYEVAKGLDPDATYFAYNALDSAVTLRVHEALTPLLARNPYAAASYSFVRSMQAPALDMMLLGIMIQRKVRLDEIQRFEAIKQQAQARLDTLADALWGPETVEVRTKRKETWTPIGKKGQPLKPRERTVVTAHSMERLRGLNAGSSKQVLAFFNIILGFPVEYALRKTAQGHERTPTADDKALLKWAKMRTKGPGVDPRDRSVEPLPLAAPIVSLILTIRDAGKTLSFLRSTVDPDGRWRCSYNVVGTETGRWSSSSNAFGRASNTQNVTGSLRRMFCADDGYWLLSVDEEQAESRVSAGFIYQWTGDTRYWDACEGDDLHTQVCVMTWPELPWSADPAERRALAETIYPPLAHIQFTYRDCAKRFGHGSNYGGTPFGIAQAVGVPVRLIEDFQARYFAAFPAHLAWHDAVREQIRSHQFLDTPYRRRHFFGRPNDPATHREATAHGPQNTVGEHLNLVMLKFWRQTKRGPLPNYLPGQLLLQNHDSFTAQFPLSFHPDIAIERTNQLFTHTPLTFTSPSGVPRALLIPGEFKTGFNWADRDKGPDPALWTFKDGNPDGLTKWTGGDTRVRQQAAAVSAGDWFNL